MRVSRSDRRSDRRASRRVVLAAVLLRLGHDVVWISFITGVPVALVDMLGDELHRTPPGAGERPRSRYRRLADITARLLTLVCIGACVVAVAERAPVLSVAAAIGAMVAIAYRWRRAGAGNRVGLPSRDQPADPRGVGRD